MNEIIAFLTAGAFVYFGLKVKFAFGDPVYYILVGLMLLGGFLISYYKGV